MTEHDTEAPEHAVSELANKEHTMPASEEADRAETRRAEAQKQVTDAGEE
jgi:hypothetical protein